MNHRPIPFQVACLLWSSVEFLRLTSLNRSICHHTLIMEKCKQNREPVLMFGPFTHHHRFGGITDVYTWALCCMQSDLMADRTCSVCVAVCLCVWFTLDYIYFPCCSPSCSGEILIPLIVQFNVQLNLKLNHRLPIYTFTGSTLFVLDDRCNR